MTNTGIDYGRVFAIHGFFGLPTDWSTVEGKLALAGIGELRTTNLWSDFKQIRNSLKHSHSSSGAAFSLWAELFVGDVRELTAHSGEKPLLMGYSLGGRLAMAALLAAPDLFAGAVIISAHPGLSTQEERRTRLESDAVWATKFRELPWDELTRQWNSQTVLNSEVFARREANFDREILAEAVENWSLGAQPDYREKLKSLDLPILFLTGEKDQKYSSVYQALAPLSRGQKHVIVPGAGHRVPWEAPDAFSQALKAYFKT